MKRYLNDQGARAMAACALLALAGCGISLPGSIDKSAKDTPPPAAPAEQPLSAYLHDLSVADPNVTFDNAKLEHYTIPTSSGASLDAWIRRPPGDDKQPLVLNITPYYGGGDPTSPANLLGETTVTFSKFILPYGYAIGHLSVGGTGNSGGCFRDGGAVERKQLYDAVEFFAAQPWSNGKVGAIGVSYDGTTANELFVEPPPSLKTVVPMEAITDYYRYSMTNGMRRSTNGLFTAYYFALVGASPAGLNGGLGVTDPTGFLTELLGEACADQVVIQAQGVQTFVTGDKVPEYWDDRDAIALIKANPTLPRPPMFYIEGYQDANVDTHHTEGFLEAVKETGVPLHIWFGQWVHNYPQPGDGSNCTALAPCRGDFFNQALVAWFDQWLKDKDTGILDAPMVQTQGDDGVWRHESDWPPPGIQTLDLHPTADNALGTTPVAAGHMSYTDSTLVLEPGSSLTFTSDPLPAAIRLTGMPRLETLATADGPVGGLIATLMEQTADGKTRYVNFAIQSLNHAVDLAHGDRDISGKAIPVNVNMFTQDNIIQAGSKLVLVIGSQLATADTPVGADAENMLTIGPTVLPIGLGANVQIELDKTTLRLPVNPGNRVELIAWPTDPTPVTP